MERSTQEDLLVYSSIGSDRSQKRSLRTKKSSSGACELLWASERKLHWNATYDYIEKKSFLALGCRYPSAPTAQKKSFLALLGTV
jgi:hypothetical protein